MMQKDAATGGLDPALTAHFMTLPAYIFDQVAEGLKIEFFHSNPELMPVRQILQDSADWRRFSHRFQRFCRYYMNDSFKPRSLLSTGKDCAPHWNCRAGTENLDELPTRVVPCSDLDSDVDPGIGTVRYAKSGEKSAQDDIPSICPARAALSHSVRSRGTPGDSGGGGKRGVKKVEFPSMRNRWLKQSTSLNHAAADSDAAAGQFVSAPCTIRTFARSATASRGCGRTAALSLLFYGKTLFCRP